VCQGFPNQPLYHVDAVIQKTGDIKVPEIVYILQLDEILARVDQRSLYTVIFLSDGSVVFGSTQGFFMQFSFHLHC
jgi:hypothetical protein